ncbi:MAG: hypothetical protein WBC73_11170, partial [Phormidesmis sp.]
MQRTTAKPQPKSKTTASNATDAAVRYAEKNPTVIYWLACNVAAGLVALLPHPAAPIAGAAAAGGANAGFYVTAGARKRIEAAERADKLDR